MKSALLALEKRLPAEMNGLQMHRAMPICKAAIRETLTLLSEQSPKYWGADGLKE
jgi:hypothetical protein